MRHSFIQLIACSALYLLSAMSADADTYDAVTNQLTAPSVLFAGNTYAGVTVTVGALVRASGGAAVGLHDTYNASTNQLTIPSVLVGNTTFTNVVITVGNVIAVGGFTPPALGVWGNSNWGQSTWQ